MATLLLSLQVLQLQANAAAQFLQQNQPDTVEGQYEDRPPDPEPDEEEAAEHMRRAEHYRARLSQALYHGAGVSCLEADVLLFGWRTKYAVKNRAFDELVRMLHSRLLPSDNLLPPSLYMFRKVSSSSETALATLNSHPVSARLLQAQLLHCAAVVIVLFGASAFAAAAQPQTLLCVCVVTAFVCELPR